MSIYQENIIWQGKPSHLINFKIYFFCVLFFWLAFPLLIILWKWAQLKNTRYELINQRLKIYTSVFSRNTDEMELYRIRDYRPEQPFFLRLFGYGHLHIIARDATTPQCTLLAIKRGQLLKKQLRLAIEERRNQRQVRSLEMD